MFKSILTSFLLLGASLFFSSNAHATSCPEYSSGSVVSWFDSIGSISDYATCNEDITFLETIHSEFKDDLSIDSRQIIAGTLKNTPLVFGADALTRTRSFSDNKVRNRSWKNESLAVRAFLCERARMNGEFVSDVFCSGTPKGAYSDVNVIGKTMSLAQEYGVSDYRSYMTSDEFNAGHSREIQKIYDRASQEAEKKCSETPRECSFMVLASL